MLLLIKHIFPDLVLTNRILEFCETCFLVYDSHTKVNSFLKKETYIHILMRISVASDLVLKYGRRGRRKYLCSKYCKNFHISLLNAASASRVFVLYRRLQVLNKSQRNLHHFLESKIELAIETNSDLISLKYYLVQVINENIEKMM